MSEQTISGIVQQCERHAQRLTWALQQLKTIAPLSPDIIAQLSNEQVAIVDQSIFRLAKLQDAMGARLFPALLNQLSEPGPLPTFIDKLNRMKEIGALE